MVKITLISVGKIKENYWQASIDEYLKRMQPYAKINIIDLPEEKNQEQNNKRVIIKAEGIKIIKLIPKESTKVVLDLRGQKVTSEDFACKLNEWSDFGKEVCFIIGGPMGLSPEVYEMANQRIALSTMTFTHQMAKVILIEQIYRALTIQAGKKYHY